MSETQRSPTELEKRTSVSTSSDLTAANPSGAGAPQSELRQPPHTLPAEKILSTLKVDPLLGLAEDKAAETLKQNGPNRLKPPAKPSRLKILIGQIANAMCIVLIAAMAVSFGTQDWIAGGVIGALVFLNVTVGYSQEWKAEKTLSALQSVGSPVATVVRHTAGEKAREGKVVTIPTEEVVVGDIVLVKIGDVVPADCRALPGHLSNLECDEALLTGESLPVAKVAEPLDDPTCPVGDRVNMIYSGSQVTKGRVRAVVTMTGMATELGKIADALERKEASQKSGFAKTWESFLIKLGLRGTTPLQIKLNQLAYLLLGIAIVLAIIVVASTAFQDIPDSIATYAVAAAVSLLPASLVAVVSLTLAMACRDLAKRNALVRRMDAVETLSGVSDICSDKTGTITVGRMVLKKTWVPVKSAFPQGESARAEIDTNRGQLYSVESGRDPYYPRGTIRAFAGASTPERRGSSNSEDEDYDDPSAADIVHIESLEPAFQELVQSAALNNMATIRAGDEGKDWQANGDPTEIALQVFAHKAGHGKSHLTHPRRHGAPLRAVSSRASQPSQQHPHTPLQRIKSGESAHHVAPRARVDGHYEMLREEPFDSMIKRMSTVWQFIPSDPAEMPSDQDLVIYMKGAVERILDRCTHIGLSEGRRELTAADRDSIIANMDKLAAEGLRVLALAGKTVPYADMQGVKTATRDSLESEQGFLGLVGIYDPPRPESRRAVMNSHSAGIVPRMLTGDHAATASAIAMSVGILAKTHSKSAVMTGQEFDALTEQQIDELPELPVVLARCAPETKVRMVEALHRRGRKTVMTGDGVNDSPALKRADVGVAMGLNGSDVAKGAADIVLADDNFSTIVRAIRKGRAVFQNLSKFLVYLLSGNVAEVFVLLIGLAVRRDGIAVYPISPVAALWVNTIAAGPPALALGLEPTAPDAMALPPASFQSIFTVSWFLDVIGYGIFIGGQTLANFAIVQYGVHDGVQDIGLDCNAGVMHDDCEIVFQARGCAFATLQILLMVHGLTCKNLLRSIFKMNLLDNPLLLWSVGALALSVFPIVYIPVINTRVFQVTGLTWEWGLVFAQVLVYFIFAESYKLIRRRFTRTQALVGHDEEEADDRTMHLENTLEPSRQL